ncbi:putative quinol monooxygenase [Mesorhizobium sp.]|uniref:putative quinol monooxygenase n=1 Tax=Mesorhizobium sp. TaxID=1871066 RepID=UPI000FE377E4|nr:putative quinol monooxygenase [Mesorhizobium sp.]RWH66988.1 MAG: antibiotic biosynthesis monooxygenase [Mesorhizobium sp.]RWL22145.1 MAG: antibiotic biosynthesis monooxygenase [Mesorhizobium sp.]RWL24524.1 MAG: antibiotic biosynthesis monooxygenase [Mesorhizobium sp.]RWL29974.1 MAG: antibiotic biosynthesis monooxygenase [Mesorhizobium sp.]RWL47802.1 MAG: antibiotic biosynthesis monooxygenase [Mesorhizobium sp.]
MSEHRLPPFVVIPEFRVRPQVRTAFLDAALDDAQHSLADEAGCRRFDVVCPESAEDMVLFYEIYDDRAAFDAHLQTPHLKRFQAAMKALEVEETVVRFAALENG